MIKKTIERFRHKRVHYTLIALQQGDAMAVSGLTRNTDIMFNATDTLTTGGKTNMTAGFQLIRQQLKNDLYKKSSLYIFSDGRINAGNTTSPFEEAISYYKTFLKHIKNVHVIDSEMGFVKLGRSKELARAIGATYSSVNQF